MGISINYDQQEDLMLVTVTEQVKFNEIEQTIFILLQHPDFRPDINVLWNAIDAKIEITDPSHSAIFDLASKLMQFSEQRGYGKTALVTSSPLYFGLARQFQAYMANTARLVNVFKELDIAKEWLRE